MTVMLGACAVDTSDTTQGLRCEPECTPGGDGDEWTPDSARQYTHNWGVSHTTETVDAAGCYHTGGAGQSGKLMCHAGIGAWGYALQVVCVWSEQCVIGPCTYQFDGCSWGQCQPVGCTGPGDCGVVCGPL